MKSMTNSDTRALQKKDYESSLLILHTLRYNFYFKLIKYLYARYYNTLQKISLRGAHKLNIILPLGHGLYPWVWTVIGVAFIC